MTGNLFATSPPSDWTGVAAIGGPEEHDDDHAMAFRTAGEIVADYWTRHQADDSLATAILYNYRHALELELKTAVGLLVATWRFELDPREPEPSFLTEAIKKASSSHRLEDIGDLLQQLLERTPYFRMKLATVDREVLDDLHDLDPSGQSLRYTVTYSKKGPEKSLPTRIYINIREFTARANSAFDAIADIVARLVEIQDAQQMIGPERLLAG